MIFYLKAKEPELGVGGNVLLFSFLQLPQKLGPHFFLDKKTRQKNQDPLEASPRKNPAHGSPSESGHRYGGRKMDNSYLKIMNGWDC